MPVRTHKKTHGQHYYVHRHYYLHRTELNYTRRTSCVDQRCCLHRTRTHEHVHTCIQSLRTLLSILNTHTHTHIQSLRTLLSILDTCTHTHTHTHTIITNVIIYTEKTHIHSLWTDIIIYTEHKHIFTKYSVSIRDQNKVDVHVHPSRLVPEVCCNPNRSLAASVQTITVQRHATSRDKRRNSLRGASTGPECIKRLTTFPLTSQTHTLHYIRMYAVNHYFLLCLFTCLTIVTGDPEIPH